MVCHAEHVVLPFTKRRFLSNLSFESRISWSKRSYIGVKGCHFEEQSDEKSVYNVKAYRSFTTFRMTQYVTSIYYSKKRQLN